MSFLVSVIIPVYNCECYIEKSIKSALQQPEVLEVVVVNDGSTDNTQEIINKLAFENQNLKIYHHPNNVNKGRAATRNLGIKKARGNYIAYLDADDFYLPNRFSCDKTLFENNKDVDGVYNAIGTHLYRDIVNEEEKQGLLELLTLKKVVQPHKLFDAIISGRHGFFSIDGMTLKKTVVQNIGGYNQSLVVAEDTDFILKLALKYNLYSGVLDKPLAMRGIHAKNVFNNEELYKVYNLKMYESLYFWTIKNKFDLKIVERFLERMWLLKYKQANTYSANLKYWFFLILKSPRVLKLHLFAKYSPIVRFMKKTFFILV